MRFIYNRGFPYYWCTVNSIRISILVVLYVSSMSVLFPCALVLAVASIFIHPAHAPKPQCFCVDTHNGVYGGFYLVW
jgi:hypothetical protein